MRRREEDSREYDRHGRYKHNRSRTKEHESHRRHEEHKHKREKNRNQSEEQLQLPQFLQFETPDKFFNENHFTPELKNLYAAKIGDQGEEMRDAGNVGAAQFRYPEKYNIVSEPYTGISSGSGNDTYRHGERTAIYNALNGEIPKLRTSGVLKYDKNSPHSRHNIRRPESSSPDRKVPNINQRLIQGLERMSKPEYFNPLKKMMNKKDISIDVLSERVPCQNQNGGCTPFLQNNLPRGSVVGSNYQNNNNIAQKRSELSQRFLPQAQFLQQQNEFVNNALGQAGDEADVAEYMRSLQEQQQFAHGGRVKDTDIMDFIEANKKRRSQPRMPNLHHDAVKRGFTIASSDPKEINRLLELTENGTSKEFNDYLLSIGMNQVSRKKPKNILDKFLEQLEPPKYPKPRNKLEKIADDLGEAMNFGN